LEKIANYAFSILPNSRRLLGKIIDDNAKYSSVVIDTDISSHSRLCTNVLDLTSLILQVFKTASKGWGVRTWDTILPGAPICEYTGVLRRTEDLDGLQNNYVFDIDCLQTMKGLDGREVMV
jgi:hypothetical protein